jgi:hypothetical protein
MPKKFEKKTGLWKSLKIVKGKGNHNHIVAFMNEYCLLIS